MKIGNVLSGLAAAFAVFMLLAGVAWAGHPAPSSEIGLAPSLSGDAANRAGDSSPHSYVAPPKHDGPGQGGRPSERGTTYYVATGGNDSTGDGSEGNPWLTLQHALTQVIDGDAIWIKPGTYVESGQLVVDHDLWIAGWAWDQTILNKAENTGDPSSGDARGWFRVTDGKYLELSDMTLDGTGRQVCIGVLAFGKVWVHNCHIQNIGWTPSSYYGRGVCAYYAGGGVEQNIISDCEFANIGRIGVFTFGTGVWTQVTNVTYFGKGAGLHLDYAFEVGGGAEIAVYCSNVSACRGVAYDGSTSAGILATSYFAVPPDHSWFSAKWNVITDCTTGIVVGYDDSDATYAQDISKNKLSGNNLAIANSSTTNLVNAPINWFGFVQPGDVAGQLTAGVDYSPWLATGTGLVGPEPEPCFNPDLSVLWADDDSPTYYPDYAGGIIGEAIDLVSGSTVNVAAGTYAANLILNKNITLQGAQAGVDACGRTAIESILTATPGTTILTLQTGCAGAIIDGFTFSGATRGIESASGPLNGLQILNNRFVSFTGNAVFLNDNGTQVTAHQNSIDGTSAGGGGLFHLDQDNFDGFYFTDNCVVNGVSGTGLFVDGDHNVDNSSGTRAPMLTGNIFQNNGTGANLGRMAFGFGTIQGNTFRLNIFDGLQGGIQNSAISENTFDANVRSGLALTGFGGGTNPNRGAKNCTITNNQFTANGREGLFLTSTQYPGTISTNVAHNNDFVGNGTGGTWDGVFYSGTETIDVGCNWWGNINGPDYPPTNPDPLGDDLAVTNALYAPWLSAPQPGGSCDGFGPNHVAGNTSDLCLSNAHTCVSVPVIFNRADTSPARGASVTFQLSSNLELCGAVGASIHQGSWLSGYGTTFQTYNNGGGSYTVDQAILGTPCGTTTGGTLFTIDVKRKTGEPDGSGTITVSSVIVRDCNNAPLAGIPGAPAMLPIDFTAPLAVANVSAAQLLTGNDTDGTTKINLSFTPPSGGGYLTTDLYRKGFGNYPEYDDAPGAGAVPSIPATPDAAVADGWSFAGSSSSGAFADEPALRDFYYYVAFSRDGCGNVSAVSNMTGGTLNYHLGDVHNGTADCAGNNQVNISDITFLGGHYGITLGISDPLGCLDVGPTTDYSVNARPTTDNVINFEDLIMFAINYGTVSFNGGSPAADLAGSTPAQEHPRLVLGTEAAGIRGTLIARLRLEENQASVKGIHAGISYDSRRLELLDVTPGALVQGETFFKHLPGESGITVDAAALGHDAVIQGSGEVAVLRFRIRAVGAVPALKSADLRDRENRFLGDQPEGAVRPVVLQNNPQERTSETSALPAEISFLGARPNPSSGSTELIFRLPTDQGVRIRIFDVSGRLVRTVVDRAFPAGEHAVNWDGKTDLGEKAGTGIYFCTFQAGNVDLSQKLYRYR